VSPRAKIVPMVLRALWRPNRIRVRKVDGWETLSRPIERMVLDLAAWTGETRTHPEVSDKEFPSTSRRDLRDPPPVPLLCG